jgi:adenylate kinase
MKAGGLVSDDLILRLIRNELIQRGWLNTKPNLLTLCSSDLAYPEVSSSDEEYISASHLVQPQPKADPSASFILDGFPRTAGQAESLDAILPINLAVSVHTPVDVILERISGRWVHEASGRVYNTGFNAPKVPGRDDVTGEPLVKRPDDDEAVFRERFRKFEETSRPLLDHYAQKGVLWEVSGMCSDDITPKLFEEFERRFC